MDPTQIKDENFPKLDIKNVISILISSDFLQMMILVDECIEFVVNNLHDVVRLPIDMNCLSNNLTKRISDSVTIEKLDDLVDKRDKLTSKLFMKKLQALISNSEGNSSSSFVLNRCIYCGQLYTGE
jgi:aryl-phospho-beta-D-glucosidase BglC (GH1 family)